MRIARTRTVYFPERLRRRVVNPAEDAMLTSFRPLPRCTITLLSLVLSGTLSLFSQTQTESSKAIRFAIVSVRPSSPDAKAYFEITENGLTERANTLFWLVQLGYGLPLPEFVIGAPDWTSRQKFDVSAKVDDEDLAAYAAMTPEQKAALMQGVLKDRFRLRFHDETRIFPRYGLHVSRGGPKPEMHPTSPGQQQVWKVTRGYHLEAKNIKITDFCSMLLSTEAQQLVVDETNLNGAFDFALSWRRPDSSMSNNADPDAPEIFDAVKQQLGLEMIRERVPSRVLVVESIEQPTAN